LGLPPITTDGLNGYAEDTQPPMGPETGTYEGSGGLADYYGGFGPPVVTYYTPPWSYYPLYSWVSYPFWCDKVYFPGFFVLRRFHCVKPVAVVRHPGSGVVIISGPAQKVVTNRVVDPATHKVLMIDPSRRSTDPAFRFVPPTSTARFAEVQPPRGSNVVMERGLSSQMRHSFTQAVVVKGSHGEGSLSTSQGPRFVPPVSVARPDGNLSPAPMGNRTTSQSFRVSTIPVGPRIRVFSRSTAGLPQAGMTPERSQNPTLPGHNRDRMVSTTDRGLVERQNQVSSSQITRNNPTRGVSTPGSSQAVGSTALPEATEVPPANRGIAPERSGSVGYRWGNAGTGFGAGRLGSFGWRGGFGRR